MKLSSSKLVVVAAFAALLHSTANATVIGGAVTGGTALTAGGTFVSLGVPLGNPFGAPNSVGNDTFQSPNLYAFNEDQNVFVTLSPLLVDEIWSGGAGTLAVGTEVASHYVFFDPGPSQSQTGYVDFDAKILAVITNTGTLAASDYLANTGVNYLNPSARGLEPGDSATIDGVHNYRLNVSWTAVTPGDYVRVLTEHSPAAHTPDGSSTLLLLSGAIALFGCLVRRR